MKIAEYWKAVVALVGAIAVAGQAVVSDGMVTDSEWVNLALAVVTAVGVLVVKNEKSPSESD